MGTSLHPPAETPWSKLIGSRQCELSAAAKTGQRKAKESFRFARREGWEVQEIVRRLLHRRLWNRLSRSRRRGLWVGRNCFMFGFREGLSVGFVRLMPGHLFQLTLKRYTAKIAQKLAVAVKVTDRFLEHSPSSLLGMTSADSCYKKGFCVVLKI